MTRRRKPKHKARPARPARPCVRPPDGPGDVDPIDSIRIEIRTDVWGEPHHGDD